MKQFVALSLATVGLSIQPLRRTGALIQGAETSTSTPDFTCVADANNANNGICCLIGDKGETGPQGPVGANGGDGLQGNEGGVGPDGEEGKIGVTGGVGAQGAQGDTGGAGPTGDTGAQGAAGDQGAPGAQGGTGPDGAGGVAGEPGVKGEDGAVGSTGPAGDQGVAGVTRVAERVGVATIPAWSSGTKCISVTFNKAFPSSVTAADVSVQASLGHNAYTGTGTHDATQSWLEDITLSGFKFCTSEVLQASGKSQTFNHGSGAHDGNGRVNYVASSTKATSTATMASATYPEAFLSSKNSEYCMDVTGVASGADDVVLSTLVHRGSSGIHQPISVWGEGAESGKMRFCAREPQGLDQKHWGVSVDVASFPSSGLPEGSQGAVLALNGLSSSSAACSEVTFPSAFTAAPAVVVSIDHRTYTGTGIHDQTTYWVEGVTATKFRVCAREMDDQDGPHDGNLRVSWLAAPIDTDAAFLELGGEDNTLDLSAFIASAVLDARCGTAFTGPVGDVGIQGETGAPGNQGAAGNEGKPGNKGEDGGKGATGADGPKGLIGDTGAAGPDGATGPVGVAGEIGATGETGARGVTGADGPKGFKGSGGNGGGKGEVGPPGAQGAQGVATFLETGAAVQQKLSTLSTQFTHLVFCKGAKGATGAQGAKGANGPTGATGDDGQTGPTGETGGNGVVGDTGAPGGKGDEGPDGVKGGSGSSGGKGATGSGGLGGADGPQGETGPQGPTGKQGDTGAPGATGDKGPDGAKGVSA